MPARAEEIHHAEEEGIQFEFLVAPVEVLGNEKKWVTGLKCVRMQLGEPDASGRARPVVIPGSEFVIPCDVVVVAIGTRANPLLTATCPDLKLNKWGNIIVDDNGMTSLPGRVRRRRHRPRRRHGHPRHGRRQTRRQGDGRIPARQTVAAGIGRATRYNLAGAGTRCRAALDETLPESLSWQT